MSQAAGSNIAERGSVRQRLRLAFSDEQKFWRLCTAVFCAFAVIKGITGPGRWALTQTEIDYSHGFVKRGLQGAVLGMLHLRHYHVLSVVFFLQLAALFGALCLLTRSARPERRFGNYAPIALFASSYAVTFTAHIVGYTDILLAAITVLLLLIRNDWKRFWCSLLVVPVALLIHESFLLMYLPVLLFSFALPALINGRSAQRKVVLQVAILGAVALAVTLATSLRPHLSAAEVAQIKAEAARRADFETLDVVFDVLSRPLSASLGEGLWGIQQPQWLMPDVVTFINDLPPVLFLLYVGRRLLRATVAEERCRRAIALAVMLAMLTPLTLYALGMDGARWNTVAVFVLFMALLVLCRDLPEGAIVLSRGEMNVAVFVLAINMACGMGLFDNDSVTAFPFFPSLWSSFR